MNSLTKLLLGGWNVIGGSLRAATFQEGNVWFVDGDQGSADNPGSGPGMGEAVALPTTAVAKAWRGGIIYVKPRYTVASAQTYYADNITIPLTKPGIGIYGAGANPVRPFLGVAIKASVVTLPVIDVLAADVHLEGMRLAGTGQTAGYPIIQANQSATSKPTGLQVVFCRLDNAKTGGAIKMDSPYFVEVFGCSFDECAVGITNTLGYGGYAQRYLRVESCDFGGRPSTRNIDIYISQGGAGAAGQTHDQILNCNFLDGLPALGATNLFIDVVNGDAGDIMGCTFACIGSGSAALTFGAAGSGALFPTTWFMSNCWAKWIAAGSGQGAQILTT